MKCKKKIDNIYIQKIDKIQRNICPKFPWFFKFDIHMHTVFHKVILVKVKVTVILRNTKDSIIHGYKTIYKDSQVTYFISILSSVYHVSYRIVRIALCIFKWYTLLVSALVDIDNSINQNMKNSIDAWILVNVR